MHLLGSYIYILNISLNRFFFSDRGPVNTNLIINNFDSIYISKTEIDHAQSAGATIQLEYP